MKAKNKKKTKLWLVAILAAIVLTAAASLAYLLWGGSLTPKSNPAADDSWIQEQNRVNILLLGSDDKLSTESRTDTIILASFDTVAKKVSLLSIPRDTRVEIPGHGIDKINAANQIGGVQLSMETLSNLLKVPIDYYILTNFDGFKGIVDTLGGVEIDVEQEMHYKTYDGEIDLNKGLQRLDGEKALQYVRFRHDKLGDISRTQRQQKFLTALAKEMSQPQNIVKLPLLLPQLMKATETDLSLAQLVGLARQADQFDMSQINAQTLPGNFATIKGVSYWLVDMEKTPEVVREIFAGETKELIDTDLAPEEEQPKKSKPESSSQQENIPPEEPAQPSVDDPNGEAQVIIIDVPSTDTGDQDSPPASDQPPEPPAEDSAPGSDSLQGENPDSGSTQPAEGTGIPDAGKDDDPSADDTSSQQP